MIIGIPKEIKEGENRVALTPAGADRLVRDGHTVIIEKNAGKASGFSDDDYAEVGADIAASAEKVFHSADLIIKVKEPLKNEFVLLREGQTLFTYLHLASSRELVEGLLTARVTAVAYETVKDIQGRLPLLVPMSEVAGRMAAQIAIHYLEADFGGRGILVSGVPGVPSAEALVLGGGIVGFNAARQLAALGARVTIVDVSHDRLKYADDVTGGRIATLFSTPWVVEKMIRSTDIVIGAVLVTGAKAPILVTEAMVGSMKAGTVILDISVDQGGCVETIRPTTHKNPVYTLHNVIHYGVPNIPASVPRTSTYALTSTTLPYVRKIASLGLKKAAAEDPLLAQGINCAKGTVTYEAVAASLDMKWKPWSKVL